jgi:hypothetical protein
MPILGITASSILKETSSYESIATATGTGSSDTITFSSIPGTYKHLQIRSIAGDGAGNIINLRFNSDTGSNYAHHRLLGTGGSETCTGAATQTEILAVAYARGTSSNMGVSIIDIVDYGSTSKYKTVRSFNGYNINGSGQCFLSSGLWQSTSVITSITLINNGAANFTTASTFALYGIKG